MIVFILIVLPVTLALDCLVAKDVGFECEQPAQRMFYYDSRYTEKCGSNYLIPNAQYIRPNPNCPPNHVLENGVCCPTREYVCSLRDDSGSFMDGIEDRPR
ncbi:hypothetical protein ANCDUO_12609 [Ancylostoma duodenale]|uniref:Uncharacterized protein n=1 Tax=Ancylostoma duodenale TaxID=51022 RepID=A0A0C2GJE2_9BILA|nr:hypothetical protein ANCDUO_12609 [Ancylostoma duodenale]